MAIFLQRLCWNTNSWRGPTGERYAKELSYVGDNGMGHEEWNFNTSDLIDKSVCGYMYYSPSPGHTLWRGQHDIYFYAISPQKQRHLVGCYKQASFISEGKRKSLRSIFETSPVFEKRVEELCALCLPSIPDESEARSLLLDGFSMNIRVRPDDIRIYRPQRLITKADIGGREPKHLSRYTKPLFLSAPPCGRAISPRNTTSLESGYDDELLEDAYVRHTKAERKVIARTHNQLSNRFRKWLKGLNAKGVRAETSGIDVVCTYGGKEYLFELKSCYRQSSRQALREALGQLFEYSYYPGRKPRECLAIVVDIVPDPSDVGWFRTLNQEGHAVELFWVTGNTVYSPRLTKQELPNEAKRGRP